mmetsp:Transcript_40842/g.63754  ORF Transcript_40842/g.63754 Transcript_40842/m.63754 type:complete len:112 (+) Transcript_40842:391-726(+)
MVWTSSVRCPIPIPLSSSCMTRILRCDVLNLLAENYTKIGKVERPVLVMHGTDDDVVPCHNGRKVHKLCKNPYEPLWIEGVGHNDMPEQRCLDYVRGFFEKLKEEARSKKL